MSLKRFIYTAAFLIVYTTAFAQLKVDNAGRIGMGTNWPNPGYKCHIKGNLLLTTYPSVPFYEFKFKVGNGWPGTEIGSTADKVAFWSTWVGYNKLYAEQFYKMSDSAYKTNLTPISDPVTKLLALKAYTYDFRDSIITSDGDSTVGTLKQYGFISQEVEKTLPEVKITEDGKGAKLLDYDQIIPLLVAGMQEQQQQLNALEAEIALLKAADTTGGGDGHRMSGNDNTTDASMIMSISPNPFNSSATVTYYLASKNAQALIKIWDVQGVEKKIYSLTAVQENNQITISSNDLPVGGTYICALIVNGRIVDAKTIILNK